MNPDITFDFKDFNATTATVAWATQAGKALFVQMFGLGSTSVEMPKSKAVDFARFVEQKGLRTN